MDPTSAAITGQAHWAHKGDVKLFLWEKRALLQPNRGTLVFVHLRYAVAAPFAFVGPLIVRGEAARSIEWTP